MALTYEGKLTGVNTTEIVHPSGAVIATTAPGDNGGDGSLFSPTDLFAASLGSCALTIVGLYAQKHNIPLQSARFSLTKEMATDAPRRVGKIHVDFYLESSCSDEQFKRLVAAAKACPVKHSLSPQIELTENFNRV